MLHPVLYSSGVPLHRYRMIQARARAERDREVPTVRHPAAIPTLDSVQYRSLYRHRYRITEKAFISDRLHHRVGKCIS